MRPELLIRLGVDPALSLLPAAMTSTAARAMAVAIALQESKMRHRHQIVGTARGYWQFERISVLEVLTNAKTQPAIHVVLSALDYPPEKWNADHLWTAVEHNDVLAAAFARCLLWRLPEPLPARSESAEGWRQYIKAWKPGRPHPDTWDGYYEAAWNVVEQLPLSTVLGPALT